MCIGGVFVLFSACNMQRDKQSADKNIAEYIKRESHDCLQLKTPGDSSRSKLTDLLMYQDESDLLEQLGRPNKTELYERGQKFLHYNICPSSNQMISIKIRISPLGQSSEVLFVSQDS